MRLTLGVLFPRNMGHYGQNRRDPGEAFRALRHQASGVRFVAYHPRPSGNFVFHDSDEESSRAAAEASQRVFGLKPVVRQFPQLSAIDWSAPSPTRSTPQGSVEVDTPDGSKKLVVVLLSEDVGVQQRITGPLRRRIEVLSWPSAREALCLYERPADGGSYGQVAEAVGRAVVALGGSATLYGTGRGLGVVRDILNGILRVDGLLELDARRDRIDLRGPVDHL